VTRDRIVAVVLLIALVLAAAFGTQSKRDTTRTRSTYFYNPGGAAAWYELAQRERLPVTRFALHHSELTQRAAGTLVQTLPGPMLGIEWQNGDNTRVHDWISAGGHLVVVGAFEPDTQDKSEFDLAYHQKFGNAGALRGPWSERITRLPLRGDLRLDVPKRHAQVLLSDALGALVVRVTTGKGWVTESITIDPIENANIGTDDNAVLAYLLLDPDHARAPIAFDEGIHGFTGEVRPWYQALTSGELLALAIALFAVLLWLAEGAFPLGPPVRIIPPREPTSAEFIDAVAALYARARARLRAADTLIADARRSLERAPRTPEALALAARIDAAADTPPNEDAQLVALARLAYHARKDTLARERR
jgi:hypothetical protein